MEAIDFIEKLKELTQQEDIILAGRDVNELRSKYEDYVLEEERKQQVAELEAQDRGEQAPENNLDLKKDEFYQIFDAFRNKRKEAIDAKNKIESENLALKRSLIKRLQEVVTSEENIGAAFGAFKEIQEKWKTIGDIPREKRNDVQKEYSKLLEDFFYNINIYKQLKEHDFKRNHQMKLDLIEKLKELQKEESIKEIESKLKALQSEWDEIGPVPNEEWEAIKELYWTEVRSIYNRINRFYEDRRAAQLENIEKKQAIIVSMEELMKTKESWDSTKAWEEATKSVLEFQAEWKKIGFGPKQENEQVWKEFRGHCDVFFDLKKAFYEEANKGFDAIAEKKKGLIEKANELKNSTEWKETATQLIQLQKQWKQLGHAGKRNEQKLWKAFRGACDAFFDARQAHFDAKDAEFEGNLTLKKELLAKIKAYKVPEDKKQALADLKAFSSEFNSIGKVPMKVKDEIYTSYKKAIDAHYGALDMKGAEKEKILFEAKIETMKASGDAVRLFRNAKNELRKEIDKHQKEIHQLENNLGFFANSKGANSLKQEVEKKVEKAKAKIEGLKKQIRMIPNE